jgi:hypothetical protein
VKENVAIELDFEINKLTNSIENALAKNIFDKEITKLFFKKQKPD